MAVMYDSYTWIFYAPPYGYLLRSCWRFCISSLLYTTNHKSATGLAHSPILRTIGEPAVSSVDPWGISCPGPSPPPSWSPEFMPPLSSLGCCGGFVSSSLVDEWNGRVTYRRVRKDIHSLATRRHNILKLNMHRGWCMRVVKQESGPQWEFIYVSNDVRWSKVH